MNNENEKGKPTQEQFKAFQGLFDYLNKELFKNELIPTMLSFTRDKQVRAGHYVPDIWTDENGNKVSEIVVNANSKLRDTPEDIAEFLNTVAHEMVHHWQHHNGKPTRNGYHNKECADKFREIGLNPISPDGSDVGQAIDTKIIEGGKLDLAMKSLPMDVLLPFFTSTIGGFEGDGDINIIIQQNGQEQKTPETKSGTRIKYQCPICGSRVWGKAGLSILCGIDSIPFVQESKE